MELFEQIKEFSVLRVEGDGEHLRLYDSYSNTHFLGSLRKTEDGNYILRLRDSFFGESYGVTTADEKRIYEELAGLDNSLCKIRDAMTDYRSSFS